MTKKTYHGDGHTLKTSVQWHELVAYKVIEPYGWSDGYAWYEELISFEEFQVRVMKSVIEWRMSL